MTPPQPGGSGADHSLTSVYKVGPHLQVTETLSYTDGTQEVGVEYSIENISGAAVTFRAAELADLDPGDDDGRNFVLGNDGSHVLGGWTPAGALVGLQENTPWGIYQAGSYDEVFANFATVGLSGGVDPILKDNGLGAQWNVTALPPGNDVALDVTWRLAADETVNSATDSSDGSCTTDLGGCTLREALETASVAGDIVAVPEGDYQLLSHLDVGHDLTVLGGGARGTRIIGHRDSPSSGDRVIEVTNGAALDLRAVTLTNGQAGDGNGGAIHALGDSRVAISDSAISGNEAWNGGGVDSAGVVLIERSTVSGNHAWGNGGGLSLSGSVSLNNTTISGNAADTGGGMFAAANLGLDNVTIADNTAGPGLGGGLYEQVDTQTTSATNTLWARNTGGSCRGTGGAIFSNYGLADDAACFATGGSGNLSRTAIALGPLADNGGDTLTHLPGAGSDAIDHGNTTGASTSISAASRARAGHSATSAPSRASRRRSPGRHRRRSGSSHRCVNDNGGTRAPADFSGPGSPGKRRRVREPEARQGGSARSTRSRPGRTPCRRLRPAGYATAIGGACAASGAVTLAPRLAGDVHGEGQRSALRRPTSR